MYRCQVCSDVSKPGQQMLRHTVYRPRPESPWNPAAGQEIAREVAVCPTCHKELNTTERLEDLLAAHAFTRVARIEQERLRRAARKEAERKQLELGRAPVVKLPRSFRLLDREKDAGGHSTPPVRIKARPVTEPEVELDAPDSASIFGGG